MHPGSGEQNVKDYKGFAHSVTVLHFSFCSFKSRVSSRVALHVLCGNKTTEWRQLYGARPKSDRGHNNRMFTACRKSARDDQG